MNAHLSHLIHAWQSFKVLVIGDAMLDSYLNGNSERLCQEAPVPVVAVNQRQDYPGGAANVAANVASLGAKVSLLAVVGDDETGDRLKQALTQRGVSPRYLLTSSDRATLAKHRVMADSHLLVRFDQGSTEVIPLDLENQVIQQLTALFSESDAVIVSDYGYGVLSLRIIQTLAELQQAYPTTLVVDSKHLEKYRCVAPTVVKPNYHETVKLLGLNKQLDQRAEQIAPYSHYLLNLTGASVAAVTLDSEGAIVFGREQPPIYVPATPAPSHYTSGAGDTFVSTLALAFAAKAATHVAAYLASAATAIVVTQVGTTTCNADQLYQSLLENNYPSLLNPVPTYA